MKLYKKIFLVLALLSIQTQQLSFCMEQESNLQYQTYSSLFYNTLTSKYFLAAVFLYGISPFSPFSSIKNSWRDSWNRLFRSSPPSKNKGSGPTVKTTIRGNTFGGDFNCTDYSDKTGFSTVTYNGATYSGMGSTSIQNGKVYINGVLQNDPAKTITGSGNSITKEIAINPFDTVRCFMGNVIFNHTDTQNNLTIDGEDNILENLSIQVNNNTLSIAPKEGLSLNPTIEPPLIINVGLASKNKITVAGNSTFEFGTVNTDYFECYTNNSAIIKQGTFILNNKGTFNGNNFSSFNITTQAPNVFLNLAGSCKGSIAILGNCNTLNTQLENFSELNVTSTKLNNASFNLTSSSKGSIAISEDCNTLTAQLNNFSNLTSQGQAQNTRIQTFESSNYDGHSLKSKEIFCTTNNFSKAQIYATQKLEAKARDSSSITIYGKPPQNNIISIKKWATINYKS